jgi:hypothetical protein
MSHICQCQVQVLTLLQLKVPHFNIHVVIKNCIIAVILEILSHHQLHNRSTSDIGIFGHINVIYHKEYSPKVWYIPPETPCIFYLLCYLCI